MLSYLVFILALSSIAVSSSSSNNQADWTSLTGQLDRIEAKLNDLNETILACGCTCSKKSYPIKRGANRSDTPTNQESAKWPGAPLGQTSLSRLNRFNRLADNLNSIPPSSSSASSSSSSFEKQHRETQSMPSQIAHIDKGPTDENQDYAADNQLILHLETLFGDAFDNLNLIMREQLVGFKLTLNKLLGHLSEHNYQHMVMANQLGTLKDECSLAVSTQLSASNNHSNDQASSCSSNATAIRSSDAIMIARLLGEGLEQIVRKTLTSSVSTLIDGRDKQQQQQQICAADRLDEQEQQLRLETVVNRGMGAFQRRLDEIDSVVKQSANILNNLRLSRAAEPTECAQASSTATTITYTNDNDQTALAKQPATGQAAAPSRWFAGSKVPNRRQGSAVVYADSQSAAASRSRANQPRCQLKTNLVRPTSCGQLREAGANCTGLYYVFIRGTIRHVYCDMAGDEGGWTVVLRRLDKSLDATATTNAGQQQRQDQSSASTKSATPLNPSLLAKTNWLDQIKSVQLDFNQDWQVYKSGFGTLEDWSEFFIGLELLHHLTHTNNSGGGHELQVDLQAGNGSELHLRFDDFSVASEEERFRFHVGACNATEAPELCWPISRLNMSLFYAQDQLANCSQVTANNETVPAASRRAPGWWMKPSADIACPADEQYDLVALANGTKQPAMVRLTSPIGLAQTAPAGTNPNHFYWPGWLKTDGGQPLRKIVLKVRQRQQRQNQ
jgi:hypothetical protein